MVAIVGVTREKTESVYRQSVNGSGGSRNQFDKNFPFALVAHYVLAGEPRQRRFDEPVRGFLATADKADELRSREVKLR